jgi:hypothetical protein
MNVHEITDDQLLLYHYRDGLNAAERARIATALIARPEIASRLQLLVAQLDIAAAIPEAPVPAQTLQRWRAALDRAATNEAALSSRMRAPNIPRRLAVAAMSAMALAIALLLMKLPFEDRIDPSPAIAANEPSRCECGLRWHLVAAERQLAEVASTNGAERTAMIDAVIAQNRMYAIAAERAGDQRLAGALRSFTPILERLAQNAPDSNESVAEMAQLNFELRVMQARLAAGTAAPSVVTTL